MGCNHSNRVEESISLTNCTTKLDSNNINIVIDNEIIELTNDSNGLVSFLTCAEEILFDEICAANLKDILKFVADIFKDVKLDMKMTLPVEIALRCFCNLALKYTANKPIGEYVKMFCEAETNQIKDGIDRLCHKDFKTSSSNLGRLLDKIPDLIDLRQIHDGHYDREYKIFVDEALSCKHDAEQAFHVFPKGSIEKVRCIQIVCIASIASDATGERSPVMVRSELGKAVSELFETWDEDIYKHINSNKSIDTKKLFIIRGTIHCLIQCENYVAAHELPPLYSDKKYFKSPVALNKIFSTGLLGSKEEIKKNFSTQELVVVGALLNDHSYYSEFITTNAVKSIEAIVQDEESIGSNFDNSNSVDGNADSVTTVDNSIISQISNSLEDSKTKTNTSSSVLVHKLPADHIIEDITIGSTKEISYNEKKNLTFAFDIIDCCILKIQNLIHIQKSLNCLIHHENILMRLINRLEGFMQVISTYKQDNQSLSHKIIILTKLKELIVDSEKFIKWYQRFSIAKKLINTVNGNKFEKKLSDINTRITELANDFSLKSQD